MKQPDSTSEIGFRVYEHVGVGVMNVYPILPWYKKMRYKRFYRDLYQKLLRKYESPFKKENKRSKEKNVRN